MKADDARNKEGLLNSICESVKGVGRCCPTSNSCCSPEGEAKSKDEKKSALPEKHLDIEWKHFAVGDTTCERCGKTGEALNIAVEELRHELTSSGVTINFSEMLLEKARIAESNEIRINSVLLEDLLSATVVSTDCPSCGTLAGEITCCRATESGDNRYEDVPVWAIKKAAYRAIGVEMN